ncbi:MULTISPECIES: hypothetical protein [Shewanella]|jgi:hypothetical protein|uniref:Uncharacterized protein n=1 Tax=Shewanella dokdonensis TaxID=712036 RepID=A0ABX8DF04_9GAMM|nr:hypothetical protein [Shewanella dokdonensis]MCL1076489.1 hypothetical protein [Shewanella dokdonensis]QVK23290.1 hypothetical protein KHX94_00125 [Shewanella dokdonensis]
MTTQQIRQHLLQLHRQRGKLRAFAEAHQLNYNSLFKFMTGNGQLWHDNAVHIINAIQAEQLQEAA